jgi:hypothetical protein
MTWAFARICNSATEAITLCEHKAWSGKESKLESRRGGQTFVILLPLYHAALFSDFPHSFFGCGLLDSLGQSQIFVRLHVWEKCTRRPAILYYIYECFHFSISGMVIARDCTVFRTSLRINFSSASSAFYEQPQNGLKALKPRRKDAFVFYSSAAHKSTQRARVTKSNAFQTPKTYSDLLYYVKTLN